MKANKNIKKVAVISIIMATLCILSGCTRMRYEAPATHSYDQKMIKES